MGRRVAVVALWMAVVASALAVPAPNNEHQPALQKKDEVSVSSSGAVAAAASTAAPAKSSSPGGGGESLHHHEQHQHEGPNAHAGVHVKRASGFLEQLYAEPPAEMPYLRAGDRRRSNARFVRAPVKRSPLHSMIGRNKRESSADDDALALLALWATASNHDDLSLLNSLREAYPQQYYNSEVVPSYESYNLGGAQGVGEEPEIVLPDDDDEAYPRYNTWSDASSPGVASDYVMPERFTVMRRSPAGLLPILPRYHKRSVGLDEAAARGRWGAIAPQRKRFVLAKRSPATQDDVYSLAQMLGEEQSEPNVPIYRRFML